MQLWGLASPKSVGQASRLETQVRVDALVLSLKAGHSGRISIFLHYCLEEEFLPLWETSIFALKSFN